MLFKLDLAFDERAKITKSFLKSHLEGKIKGLKIASYVNFVQTKELLRAELQTNIVTLLHAEGLDLQAALPGPSEPEEGKEGSVADKMLSKVCILLDSYNDKAKRRVVTENLDKLLEPIENEAMALSAKFTELLNENIQLKDTLLRFQSTNVNQVSKSLSEAQMDQTASLLKTLENENARLQRRTLECESKLKVYEKNEGDTVFMKRISELEARLKNADQLCAEQLKEQEERYNLLSLDLLDKTDRIKELEASLGGTDRAELMNARKEIETYRAKFKEMDDKLGVTNSEIYELRTKLEGKEKLNKQLTSDLAKSLDERARLESKVSTLASELSEARARHSESIIVPTTATVGRVQKAPLPEVSELTISTSAFELCSPEQLSRFAAAKEEREHDANRVGEIEEALRNKNNQLSHLTALLAAKEEEVVQSVGDYGQAKEHSEECEMVLKQAREQLDKATEEKRAAQKRSEEAQAQATKSAQEAAQLKTMVAGLEGQLGKKEEERLKLQKMVEERNQAIRTNEDRYVEYEANKEEMGRIIASLQEKLRPALHTSLPSTVETASFVSAPAPDSKAEEEYRTTIKDLQDSDKQKTEKLQRLEEEIKIIQELCRRPGDAKENVLEKLKEYEQGLAAAQASNANKQKALDELDMKIRELQISNENLRKMAETSNADCTKQFSEIEARNANIERLRADMAQKEKEAETSLADAKEKMQLDIDALTKDKEELTRSLEQMQGECTRLEKRCGELKTAVEEKVTLVAKLEGCVKTMEVTVDNQKVKQAQDLTALKIKIAELEAQLVEKTKGAAPSGNRPTLEQLQGDIELLISEHERTQKELDRYQSAVQKLAHQVNEKEGKLQQLKEEIMEYRESAREREAKIADLGRTLARRGKEYDELRAKFILQAKAKPMMTTKLPQSPSKFEDIKAADKTGESEGAAEYLGEIVYLYKTLTAITKERIEEKKNKIEKTQSLLRVMREMSDSKTSKDRIKTLVGSSLHHFPYLEKFDMKSDYKFIVGCVLKAIEHKQEKVPMYEADCDRNGIILSYAEPKLREYSEKASAMRLAGKKKA